MVARLGRKRSDTARDAVRRTLPGGTALSGLAAVVALQKAASNRAVASLLSSGRPFGAVRQFKAA